MILVSPISAFLARKMTWQIWHEMLLLLSWNILQRFLKELVTRNSKQQNDTAFSIGVHRIPTEFTVQNYQTNLARENLVKHLVNVISTFRRKWHNTTLWKDQCHKITSHLRQERKTIQTHAFASKYLRFLHSPFRLKSRMLRKTLKRDFDIGTPFTSSFLSLRPFKKFKSNIALSAYYFPWPKTCTTSSKARNNYRCKCTRVKDPLSSKWKTKCR